MRLSRLPHPSATTVHNLGLLMSLLLAMLLWCLIFTAAAV